MADNPIKINLPADLPENWQNPMTVTAEGTDSGLSQQHGYNYLMKAVNDAQRAATEIGEAFNELAAIDPSTGKMYPSDIPTDLDYQKKTETLPSTVSLVPEDSIPVFSLKRGVNERVSILNLKAALGVQSTQIEAITNDSVSLTCVNGSTTLTGTGTTTFTLPNIGEWVVTATYGSTVHTNTVSVTGVLKYIVDMRLPSSLSVTTPPTRTSYINGDAIDTSGMVVTVTYVDETTSDVTLEIDSTPTHASDGLTQITVTTEIGGQVLTATTPITVDRIALTAYPTQSGQLTYTGTLLTPTWADYNISQLSLSGTRNATGAGSYVATFTPLSRYKWPDGTYNGYGATWAIQKAAGISSVSPTSLTLTPSQLTGTFTITKNTTGTTTVSSSNTSIATATLSGSVATVTARGNGTATIYVTVAEGTNHTAPTQKTVSINAMVVDPVLENNTWASISKVSSDRTAQNYWAVGDKKEIIIDGDIGIVTFTDVHVYAFIIGFNHNQSYEGIGIHFNIGKTTLPIGRDVAIDNGYDYYLTNVPGYFSPKASSDIFGGWENSNMRLNILGIDKSSSSTFVNALTSDLKSVIKTIIKYSDNHGTASGQSITATADFLFLPSIYEITGKTDYGRTDEAAYQQQYYYYAAGNSAVRYKHNDPTGPAVSYYWTRTPLPGLNRSMWGTISSLGSSGSSQANYSRPISPCFVV